MTGSLHAATRAGAQDTQGREALLRYVLRPAIAEERVEQRPDGLVRITLKRAYGDGTVAVDMDPLSLVARLAAAVPPPRFHTVKYAGVLASAHKWRARIAPEKPAGQADVTPEPCEKPKRRGARRLWAELLARTFVWSARAGQPPGLSQAPQPAAAEHGMTGLPSTCSSAGSAAAA